jgi:hypothetical protein
MYSILIDRLQTENSQSIVRDHENDKDAQKIIAEVVACYEKSFSQITSMKIYSTRWKGTVRNFILNWVDKVREYHRLARTSYHVTDSANIMNLVKPDSNFNNVIIRDQQRQRDGELEYSYDFFLEHLLQTADIIDGAIGHGRRTISSNIKKKR